MDLRPIITILLLLFLSHISMAQSCTGSVGDPIVNITFGAGSDTYGSPLPGGITNLSYYSFDCPNDGSYTITNQTNSCFSNSWHSTKDHTGDANGYFMLVNASEQPSVFYVQTIDGLCAGTQYRFAAWILNMCNFTSSILPSITFTIEKTDGTVLSSYSTGNIPVNVSNAEWNSYGFNFTTPDGVSSVVLRMRNNAPGGTGNDIALDDITFRPVGPTIGISIPDVIADTTLLCSSDARSLSFRSDVEQCYSSTAYQWQVSTDSGTSWSDIPGATGTTYDRTQTSAGTYLYRLAAAQKSNIGIATCEVTSKPFKVVVYDPDSRTISISQPADTICESTPVTFFAKTTFAGPTPVFQWIMNDIQVGKNDSSFTTPISSSADRISCVFTSSLACNSPATSNTVSLVVLQKARTAVTKFICEGDNYEGHTASGIYDDAFPGSNGCDSIRTLNLTVYPKQHTTLDTSICFGTSYFGLSQEGSYNYTYPDVHGCDSVHTIVLHVLPDINAKPFTDMILCSGDTIALSPGVFDTYLWQDGSTNSTYNVHTGGTYRVTATNKCGTATKVYQVTEKVCIIMFPTAFTPNGDGRNDIFRVVNGYNLTRYRFLIYNRWGQKVFETSDPAKGWNGYVNAKHADSGTYMWFCEYQRKDDPQPVHMKGTVVLIP